MASKFEQHLDFLLQGVPAVEKLGSVGVLSVFGPNAFPLIAGKKDGKIRHPFAAAGFLGAGRLLAFGHKAYVSADDPNIKSLLLNSIKWSAEGKQQSEIKVGVYPKNLNNVALVNALEEYFKTQIISSELLENENDLKSLNVVLVSDISEVNEEKAIDNLRSFVKQGGGLISASTGWEWASKSGRDIKTQHAGNKIYHEAGLGWTKGTSVGPIDDGTMYPTDRQHLSLTHAGEAFNALVDHLQKKDKIAEEELNQITAVIAEALTSIPEENPFVEQAQRNFVSHFPTVKYPTPDSPLTDPVEKLTLSLASTLFLSECAETCDVLDAAKAREAARGFPGLVSADIARTKDYEVTLNVNAKGWYSTGVYAPPFEQITVKFFPEGVTSKSEYLALQIGCHSDDIGRVGEWQRSPILTTSKLIQKLGYAVTANAFGGLIYINHTDKADVGFITLRISGGVRAPYFKLGVTTDEEWKSTIRHYQAPYGELEAHKIILSFPADRLSKLENPSELLQYWDSVMDKYADFLDLQRTGDEAPYRFVSDVQISAGLMHAGYPMMILNDDVDPALSLTQMKMREAWGHYHEIGHNHQESAWTFEGTGEVTNNVMVLYIFNGLGISPAECRPDQYRPEERKKMLEDYVKKGATFGDWQKDPWLALALYLQLAEVFGWDAYKKVFKAYRRIPRVELPQTDTGKIDFWVTTFSQTVGQNLVPLYKSWGIPISDSVKDKLAGLPETDQRILSHTF